MEKARNFALILLVFNSAFGFALGLQCHSANVAFPSPNISSTIGKQTCPPGFFCMKLQMVSMMDRRDGDIEHVTTKYRWHCTAPLDMKCGEIYETTLRNRDGPVYLRTCTCCGDFCNGATMDGACADIPRFTHKCYYYAAGPPTQPLSNPNLPAEAHEVHCTETQACMKSAYHNRNSTEVYRWGCSTPPGHKCGNMALLTNEGKICSCCGDRCNGPKMNYVLANNSQCDNMASFYEKSGKPSAKGNDDPALETSAIILASRIFAVLAVQWMAFLQLLA